MTMKYIGRALLCVSLIVIVFNACSNREDKKFDKVYEEEMHGSYVDYYFTFEPDGSYAVRDLLIRHNGRLIVLTGTYNISEDETELELRNTLGKLYFKKCDDGWMYLKSKSIEEEGALLEIEKNGLLKMFRLEDE